MGRGRIRLWDYQIMSNLVDASQGVKTADLYFNGADIVDVYSGMLRKANIAVFNQRIAYVGLSDKMIGPNTQIIEVSGKVLAPGYIEPHGHPFQLYNPVSYAKHILDHGTTCSVNDNLLFIKTMTIDDLVNLVELLATLPIKMLWSARLDPQTFADDKNDQDKFNYQNIRRLIDHPYFLQVGELTDWPSLLSGNKKMRRWMVDTMHSGKKAEGHAPAASQNTLNCLAAAGVTACHESITTEEVQRRIELGLYATLRNSSLRPDLPTLLHGLCKQKHVSWERMMMTIDGPAPSFMNYGAADYLVKIAIQNGVRPITAYQMVTRNPAVYYGLDQEMGGIAPGRIADILVLSDLKEPTPEQVYADGLLMTKRTARKVEGYLTTPAIEWSKIGLHPLPESDFTPSYRQLLPLIENGDTFPVMDLINPVITRKKDLTIGTGGLINQKNRLQIELGSEFCYAVLINREYTRIANGIVRGFAQHLDALASSYNITMDLLLIGQNPTAMILALNRVREMGGGIVLVMGGKIAIEIPLPLGGMMSDKDMPKLIHETMVLENILQQSGYPYHDPIHTLLFLPSTHLPEIRLTLDGLVMVKERRVIHPSQTLNDNL